MNRTIIALMARGIDSNTATDLVSKGYKISDLKTKSKQELRNLGLPENFIDSLFGEGRPPIPTKTANSLLYESRYCCCICRDSSKSVIIHHIIPWAESHSHEKENLVVLCLHHHDEAHTKRSLAYELTPERIRYAKERWTKEATQLDYNVVHGIMSDETVCWDFFNVPRIFEQAEKMKVNYLALSSTGNLKTRNLVDATGRLLPSNKWTTDTSHASHWLNFIEGPLISLYMSEILLEIVKKNHPKVLNSLWNKNDIKDYIKNGDFIFLQGAFYFKRESKNTSSLGQICKAYRKNQNICFEFNYDAYYCTSSTSKYCNLRGKHVESVFALVREVAFNGKQTLIKATCLAMGCGREQILLGRNMELSSYPTIDLSDWETDPFDEE